MPTSSQVFLSYGKGSACRSKEGHSYQIFAEGCQHFSEDLSAFKKNKAFIERTASGLQKSDAKEVGESF